MAIEPATHRKAVGRRLKALRTALGYENNQRGFVGLVGLTQPAWSNYEAGDRLPNLDAANRIAEATGVTLDWIYRGNVSGLPHHIAVKLADLAERDSLSA
jgi:transcriptional regulator with XRE-family HTH domain